MLRGWQGQGGEDLVGELGEGKVVGGVEFAVPFGGGEDVPAAGGDPVDASHVGSGDEAFDFEEVGVAGGAGGVRENQAFPRGLRGGLVEVNEGEHFAADGFVSSPEDEIRAPLHGFDHVREGEEVSAKAFGVHETRI